MNSIRQKGFNLIEVLIAMVILSIGLLGVAGLQLTGVRSNQSSYFRSQASSVLNDMAERIHNNIPGVNSGFYSGRALTSSSCGTAPTLCAKQNGSPLPGACSAQNMAAYDFYSVSCGTGAAGTRLFDFLPEGRIAIECLSNAAVPAVVTGANCQPGFLHQITVSWEERTAQNGTSVDSVTRSIIMRVQP